MSEYAEQKTLIAWFREKYPKFAKCTRLSLNGVNLPSGKKASIMINQFKTQGMVKGEADLFFAIPNKSHSGLFIEMKDHGKTTTPLQDEYLEMMASIGYQAEVCIGAEHAKKILTAYMSLVTIH